MSEKGRSFSVQRGATRVVYGDGTSRRMAEHALGDRILVVCTGGRAPLAARIASDLAGRAVGVFDAAKEHVPSETVEQARVVLERVNADAVLAIGGGSAIGLAKALAVEGRAVRIGAIPTTYSGSEMTQVYGVTKEGVKRTGKDERARPCLVVYDPTLTAELPRAVAVPSLFNALAHAVEATWIAELDPATLAVAEAAMRLLARALRGGDGGLEGAYLAGAAFSDAGAGLHHKLCHVLGGSFGLPHAATHAVLLPHVARAMAARSPLVLVARALDVLDPVAGLEALADASGAPRSLRSLGLKEEALDRAADAGHAAFPSVPREVIRDVLARAWAGPVARIVTPLVAPEDLVTMPGALGVQESEALVGALPKTQNTPRPAPHGLYPELVNVTPFTVRRSDNARLWLYRIRPSFSHDTLVRLPATRFAAPLLSVEPNRTRWRPLEVPTHRTDFLDGLATLGGSGGPDGPGFAVHLYGANADMSDRCFANADGDLMLVPQTGRLEVRTELGFLRVAPGSIAVIPRGLRFSVGMPDGPSRGWMLEVTGARLRLPERGPLGSNGLVDARHLRAPVASYEDRVCPHGFELVTKVGGELYAARMAHSPFDVVAWHGTPAPFSYDLALFNAMATANFDHADPSIHTALTAPLDDHGRAIVDFVVFVGRWEVAEHTFRPPAMHRNAASEINCVVRDEASSAGYDPGCTFLTPLLTAHGITTAAYDRVLSLPDAVDPPRRIPDASLWVMFESALAFRTTAWARETDRVDTPFLELFKGMRSRFAP